MIDYKTCVRSFIFKNVLVASCYILFRIVCNIGSRISKNKSHESMLNSGGPSGISHKISNSLLNEKATLTFCDLRER